MKIAKPTVIPHEPIHYTINAAINHVENSSAYSEETKHVSKMIATNIQQNLQTNNIGGIYGIRPNEVKSTIIDTLQEIKKDIAEKPLLAALKSLGVGLKLAGFGNAFRKGEIGTGEIKDVAEYSGLSVADAIPSFPPTDAIGFANLLVEKMIEFCERPIGE